MAPAPAGSPPRRKGLDLSSPGPKEYLIVGGSALGLALLYFWWRSRHAAAAAPASGSTSAPAATTPTGLSTTAFWHWVSDHQSSSTRPVRRREHEHEGHRHRDDDDEKVTVPDVTGEKYMRAAREIRSRGLIAQRGTPYVGTVRRESPHESAKVRRGTVVTLSGKSGGGGTWPKPGRHHRKGRKKRHPNRHWEGQGNASRA